MALRQIKPKVSEMNNAYIIFFFLVILHAEVKPQGHSFQWSGQASAWTGYQETKDVIVGARYLPQINYKFEKESRLFDIELSGNIHGSLLFYPPDSVATTARLRPYRAWARFTNDQLELRLGLQKINFGSAMMLRPLMWFDRLDARDPLKLTNGVWAALGRYYFLNNVNIWTWVVLPGKELKTWEMYPSLKRLPELGLRSQFPLWNGEIALSFHHRWVDSLGGVGNKDAVSGFGEQRYGIDGKWDAALGIWFEASLIHTNLPLSQPTNLQLITIGADYTFKLGNGLQLTYEHLFSSFSAAPSSLNSLPAGFSAVSLNYPFSLFDRVQFYSYRDWDRQQQYFFANYQHQFNKITLHLMAWANPSTYLIPSQQQDSNLYTGKGFQLMIVYNHATSLK